MLKGVAVILLLFGIIENGWLFLALTWNLGAMISLCIPIVTILTDLLFLWLRFAFRDDGRALLGAAAATAMAPWAAVLSIVLSSEQSRLWPGGVDAAYLLGSMVPYVLLAAVGLGSRSCCR